VAPKPLDILKNGLDKFSKKNQDLKRGINLEAVKLAFWTEMSGLKLGEV